jgi:hypothetical protein
MRLYRLFITGALLASAVTTLSVAPAAAAPAAAQQGSLLAVSGTSASNIWAVGSNGFSLSHGGGRTLIEHWNGTSWRAARSPSPGRGRDGFSILYGVAAVSPADAWAVGFYRSGSNPSRMTTRALIEHWDGARWTQVSCGCASGRDAGPALLGITAVSRTDLWAVGAGVSGPLLVHWNGRTWSTARLPGTVNDELTGVSAASARSAWASGVDLADGLALTARWNGRRWAWVSVPQHRRVGILNGVTATSPRTTWVVGDTGGGQTITLRRTGTKWSPVPGPVVAGVSAFNAVAAAPGALWAVGSRLGSHGGHLIGYTLTARFTGTRWVAVPSPSDGSGQNSLRGVYATSADNAWAVGTTGVFTILEHWNGTKWSLAGP